MKRLLYLFTQCYFLDPYLLDQSSYYVFRTRYAVCRKINVSGRSVEIVVGYRNLAELSEKLKPFSYRVLKDGVENVSATWEATQLSVNVDGLAVGEYNYTLIVYDTCGNLAWDSVIVNVTEVPPGGPDIFVLVLIAAGGIAVVVIVILVVRRRA